MILYRYAGSQGQESMGGSFRARDFDSDRMRSGNRRVFALNTGIEARAISPFWTNDVLGA